MSLTDQATVIDRYVNCLKDVAAVLERHDMDDHFRLLVVSEQLELPPGTVLVQRLADDGRELVLQPKAIADLGATDIVHDTHTLRPQDAEFLAYAGEVRAASCLTRYDLQGRPVHIYD